VLGTGWTRADAVASLLVAALMAWTGVLLVRAAGRVFLEAAPKGVDPQALGTELASIDGVAEVHDLHVWVLGSDAAAMSAHVLVRPDFDCHEVAAALRSRLAEAHGLEHVTLQVDHEEQQLHGADTCAEPHGTVYGVSSAQP
jgi:cobalt-zinc-cadmium efflux system protein